jgi:nitrate reductase gamma subunit
MDTSTATRQIYWNITHVWVMYVLLLPTAAVAGYGIYRHFSRWRRGQPAARFDRKAKRIRLVLKHAIAQRRTARKLYAGLLHQFISYGFVVLTIATTVVALDADFGTTIMRGRFYLYFQSFVVDLFGALVMLGVVMAAARRYIKRPRRLVYNTEATLILIFIFLMCLQGFLGCVVAFRKLNRACFCFFYDDGADARGSCLHVVVSSGDGVRLYSVAAVHEDDARHHCAPEHLHRAA